MVDVARYWYGKRYHFFTFLLWPFSCLFGLMVAIRKCLYRFKLIKTHYFPVPVIVVGNITVGGTGKTPFVIWLAKALLIRGYRVGIVTRGIGGKGYDKPRWVRFGDEAREVGDEALLLVNHLRCPLVICIDRVAAVRELLQHTNCQIVISDDGLQHYRLGRQLEIALIDYERQLGNGLLLPAGPLRETSARLKTVDFTIENGNPDSMLLIPMQFVHLSSKEVLDDQALMALSKKIHAVAGIGHPARFFTSLRQKGFQVIAHAFPDHHLFCSKDLAFNDDLPIVMTEKDAVKCEKFATERAWFLSVTTHIQTEVKEAIFSKIEALGGDHEKHSASHTTITTAAKPHGICSELANHHHHNSNDC